MIRAKNNETASKFVKVMPRIPWPLFSGHGVVCIVHRAQKKRGHSILGITLTNLDTVW